MAARRTSTAWQDFVLWCQHQNLKPVPANPWTLAAFLRHCENDHPPSVIERRMRTIGAVLYEKSRKRPDRDPLVLRTLERVKENHAKRRRKPEPALFEEKDFKDEKPKRRAKPKKKAPEKDSKRSLRATPKLVRKRRV